MLRDLVEVLLSAIEKGNTNVSLLQSTDIVGTVTSHEGSVASILEAKKNIFLLLRRNTCIHPGVPKQLRESLLTLELGQAVSSDT